MSRHSFVCHQCFHQQFRPFASSSTRRAAHKTNPLKLLPRGAEEPPPYPFGPARWYKQRNKGLYGNAMIQFGNNVGEEYKVKTRRTWLPNIVDKFLYSNALERKIRVKVHTRVLRTIDKVGGVDEYLIGMKSARIKELGEQGWKLRWAILQTPWGQERIRADVNLRNSMLLYEQERDKVPDAVDEVVEAPVEQVEATKVRPTEIDIEERIQRRLEEDAHMSEVPPPPSIWSRITSIFRR